MNDVMIAVRNPREAAGKAHRRAPGSGGQSTACGRPTFSLTESVPLTQTDPDDRCTFCWSADAAPVVDIHDPDVPVGRDHPETSHAAAASMRAHVGRTRVAVLRHLAASGGATMDATQEATGGIHQSVSSAGTWLEKRRLILPRLDSNGKPVTALTRSGRAARVMEITVEGRAALAAATPRTEP